MKNNAFSTKISVKKNNKKITKNKRNFLYRKGHKYILKKTHLLYTLFKLNVALKRANYDYKTLISFFKEKHQNLTLNSQAKIKEKKEKFLLNFVIKLIQKKALKSLLKNKNVNRLKLKINKKNILNNKFKKILINLLNKSKFKNQLIIPKRGSANYQFLILRAKLILKLKLNKLNFKLSKLKKKIYILNKKNKSVIKRKYSKLNLKKALLLKQKSIIQKYLKLENKKIIVLKKKQSKKDKNNIIVSYEPSFSGKSKIKVILRINKFLKRKSNIINKLHKIKINLNNNLDFLLKHKSLNDHKQKKTTFEQQYCSESLLLSTIIKNN